MSKRLRIIKGYIIDEIVQYGMEGSSLGNYSFLARIYVKKKPKPKRRPVIRYK